MKLSDLLLLSTTMTADKRQMRDRILRIAKPRKPVFAALVAALALTGAVCAVTFTGAAARVLDDAPQVDITQELESSSGGETERESGKPGYAVGWLEYDPTDVTIDPMAEPSYLEPWIENAAMPPFLSDEQQRLYRRAMELYGRMWGGDTSFIDAYFDADGSFRWNEHRTVELNDGMTYAVASGPYARWADFAALIDSVFTRDFWDAKNNDGNGFPPIYVEYQGRLAYIEASRGAGYYYNPNIPDEFRLEEKADNEIRFTLIGHYSPAWPKAGESYEERDARLAAGEEYYTLEFPIRMIRTENGWRLDEFHNPLADEYEPDGWMEAHGWFEPSPRPTAEEPTAYGVGYDDEAREAYREMLRGIYRDLSETNYAWFFHNNHSWELSGWSRASDNQFAVVDLDGNGTSELLLRYLTGRFDDFEYVFGSDYGPFELAEFYNMPAYAAYYEGGLIAVPVGGSVYVRRWHGGSFAYPPEGASAEEAQRWLEEQLGGARELDIPWQALTPENIDALVG